MKASARDAAAFLARPDPGTAAVLLYGPDAMRVALKREALVKAMIGPEGAAEMRLVRMTGAELRGDPARLDDEMRATGFFGGDRVVLVEEATDGLAGPIGAALEGWQRGDAQIVVTAGQLARRSALRKLFEESRAALAIAIYDDPPTRAEIEETLRAAGLTQVEPGAMEALTALSRALDPGDFRQTVEKLALYALGAERVRTEDVEAVAPLSTEAAADDLIDAVAEAKATEIGRMLARVAAQGTTATGLCNTAIRHFRQLHTVASDPGGPGQGIARLRPPLWGPRRDRVQRQAGTWGAAKLETALSLLTDTDLALRSAGQTAPQLALVERALIRIAMLGART